MSVRTAIPTAYENLDAAAPTNESKDGPRSSAGGATMSPIQSLKGLDADFKQFLHENRFASHFDKLEQKGIKREYVAYGALVVFALYLIVGGAAELFTNLIGFAYPAYASFKAIRTGNKEDDTLWFTYWSICGALHVVDFWSEKIMHVFPIYFLLKTVSRFLLYLSLPQTRGAQVVYVKVLDPVISRIGAKFAAKQD
ncbi:Receptor expression-enhancing protein [Aphelenchoides bicaudatus]|nr:Receptor expression-enhancing protein [Aphelenchoides bicaudatus]